MAGPRLIQVTCPECGAALRVDNGIEVVTCGYCRKSSFVHWPDRPARPTATMPGYGDIHIPAEAMQRAGMSLVLLIVGPILLLVLIAVGNAIVSAVASPPRPSRSMSAPAGPSCERAVACCKAIQPGNAGCESMRLLPEDQCAAQVNNLDVAARAMGKSCK